MEGKIKEMEDERGCDKGERKERRGWFGEECKKKKKKVRGLMKEWRRKGGIEKYTGKRRRNIESYVIGRRGE